MMEKNAKIYVAGHRGMVGSAIVRELNRQGYNNIITRKVFYIRQWNEQSGYVFFGENDDKEMMKKPYRAFCNVNIQYNTWGCDVFSIQIDDRYTYYISSNESYLYFDSGLREHYFPYNSFLFLYDIMNKYELCSIEKYYSTQSIKSKNLPVA